MFSRSKKEILSGVVGKYYHLVKPNEVSSEVSALVQEAVTIGFKSLGQLECSFADRLILVLCSRDDVVLSIMVRKDTDPPSLAAYDLFSELESGGSVTTATMGKASSNSKTQSHTYIHDNQPFSKQIRTHENHVSGHGKATRGIYGSLKDVAETIDRSMVRAAQAKGEADEPLTPEADKFLADALVEFNEKQAMLQRDWRFDSYKQWGFDQYSGTLKLEFADGSEFHADGQILGSYCASDNTWEWGWNNPDTEPPMVLDSLLVKEVGQRFGITYTQAGMIPVPSEQFVAYLCAIGLKATNSIGLFRADAGSVELMLTLKNPRWAKATTPRTQIRQR